MDIPTERCEICVNIGMRIHPNNGQIVFSVFQMSTDWTCRKDEEIERIQKVWKKKLTFTDTNGMIASNCDNHSVVL